MKVHLAISCLFAFMMINMGVEAIRKLSCSSTLRSQFPHLFTHCKDECIYGPWSSWTYETYKYNDNSVLNCFNKIAYKYKRTRVVLSDKGSCDEMVTVDFKHECKLPFLLINCINVYDMVYLLIVLQVPQPFMIMCTSLPKRSNWVLMQGI